MVKKNLLCLVLMNYLYWENNRFDDVGEKLLSITFKHTQNKHLRQAATAWNRVFQLYPNPQNSRLTFSRSFLEKERVA